MKVVLTCNENAFSDQLDSIQHLFPGSCVRLELLEETLKSSVTIRRIEELLGQPGLISTLTHLLRNCRYGLKQSEILEFLRQCQISSVAWLAFKHLATLCDDADLIRIVIDKDQVLYQLNESHDLVVKDDQPRDSTELIKLVRSFFDNQLSQQGPELRAVRAYEELPLLKQNPLEDCVLSSKWLIQKTDCTQNVLYFMQDLMTLKRQKSASPGLAYFEEVFYKILYQVILVSNYIF